MLIFGNKVVTKVRKSGEFHCPVCDSTKTFAMKRVLRFFALYFLPLFPTNTLGEYVECHHCQSTFDPQVLSYRPAEEARKIEASFLNAVKQVMIGVSLSDEHADDAELSKIRAIYHELTGLTLSQEALQNDLNNYHAQESNLLKIIDTLSGQLNTTGRKTAMTSAYLIAEVDGVIDPRELKMIREIASRLGLSAEELAEVDSQWALGG